MDKHPIAYIEDMVYNFMIVNKLVKPLVLWKPNVAKIEPE